MEQNCTFTFQVTHKLSYNVQDAKEESEVTYDLLITVPNPMSTRFQILRKNFRTNGKEITAKFEKLAHEYHESLFPATFDLANDQFSLTNYTEIKNRLNQKDNELQNKYAGSGLDHIRASFFNVAACGKSLTAYFYTFGLIKILLLSLHKKEAKEDYQFEWRTIPFKCQLSHKGKKHFNSQTNSVTYVATGVEPTEISEYLSAYLTKQYTAASAITNEPLISSINHETVYVTKNFDFNWSKTQINCNNLIFRYSESFELTRMN